MSFWDNNKDTFKSVGKATAKGIGRGTKAVGKAGYKTYKNSKGETVKESDDGTTEIVSTHPVQPTSQVNLKGFPLPPQRNVPTHAIPGKGEPSKYPVQPAQAPVQAQVPQPQAQAAAYPGAPVAVPAQQFQPAQQYQQAPAPPQYQQTPEAVQPVPTWQNPAASEQPAFAQPQVQAQQFQQQQQPVPTPQTPQGTAAPATAAAPQTQAQPSAFNGLSSGFAAAAINGYSKMNAKPGEQPVQFTPQQVAAAGQLASTAYGGYQQFQNASQPQAQQPQAQQQQVPQQQQQYQPQEAQQLQQPQAVQPLPQQQFQQPQPQQFQLPQTTQAPPAYPYQTGQTASLPTPPARTVPTMPAQQPAQQQQPTQPAYQPVQQQPVVAPQATPAEARPVPGLPPRAVPAPPAQQQQVQQTAPTAENPAPHQLVTPYVPAEPKPREPLKDPTSFAPPPRRALAPTATTPQPVHSKPQTPQVKPQVPQTTPSQTPSAPPTGEATVETPAPVAPAKTKMPEIDLGKFGPPPQIYRAPAEQKNTHHSSSDSAGRPNPPPPPPRSGSATPTVNSIHSETSSKAEPEKKKVAPPKPTKLPKPSTLPATPPTYEESNVKAPSPAPVPVSAPAASPKVASVQPNFAAEIASRNKPAKPTKPEKPEKPEKPAKPSKPAKPEKPIVAAKPHIVSRGSEASIESVPKFPTRPTEKETSPAPAYPTRPSDRETSPAPKFPPRPSSTASSGQSQNQIHQANIAASLEKMKLKSATQPEHPPVSTSPSPSVSSAKSPPTKPPKPKAKPPIPKKSSTSGAAVPQVPAQPVVVAEEVKVASPPPPPPPARTYRRAAMELPSAPEASQDIDLELSTGWFANTNNHELPKDFQGLNYTRSMQSSFLGSTAIIKVRRKDLGIDTYKIKWSNNDVSSAKSEVEHTLPSPLFTKPGPSKADLIAAHEQFGEYVASWCEHHYGQQVGRGECWDLAHDALLKGCGKHAFVSSYTHHGYQILQLNNGAIVNGPHDEIRRGDILQFKSCFFKNPATGATLTVGAPDHTAVVLANEGNSTLVSAEQNVNNVRTVVRGSYNLRELVKGEVSAYRPMPAAWAGDL